MNFFLRIRRSFFDFRSGFTLIEVIVVIGITAMLSSFLILYNQGSRQQIALFVERAKIAQVLQRAKTLSISTYSSTDAPCGYGVQFLYDRVDENGNSAPEYFIFRYRAPSSDFSCTSINTIDDSLIEPLPEFTYTLNPALKFVLVDDRIDVVSFISPNPRVIVRTADFISHSGRISISTKDGSTVSDVSVGAAGQINL